MDNNVKLKTLAYRTATGLDSANDMLTNVQFLDVNLAERPDLNYRKKTHLYTVAVAFITLLDLVIKMQITIL